MSSFVAFYATAATSAGAGVVAESVSKYRASTAEQGGLSAREVDVQLKTELATMRRAEGRAVIWFGEVVRRKLFRELGYASIHEYASRELGFSMVRTSQFLTLVGRLRELPKVRRALDSGRLPWTKAREIAKVATARTEKDWLKEAHEFPRDVLEKRVRAAMAKSAEKKRGTHQPALDLPAPTACGFAAPSSTPDETGRGEGSEGRSSTRRGIPADPTSSQGPDPANSLFDGNGSGSATDVGVPEAPVTVNLRLESDRFARYRSLIEAVRKKGHRGTREDLVLAALELLALEGAGERGGVASTNRPDCDTPNQDKTVLAQNATTEATGAGCQVRPDFPMGKWLARSPYQVTVHLCPHCGRGEFPTALGPKKIPPERLRAILCDADVQHVGKPNRAVIPPSIRREVLTRDRHECRVAGCLNTRFLQVHHLVPRQAGGSNKPDNLITLCSACHLWAHKEGHAPRGDVLAGRTGTP